MNFALGKDENISTSDNFITNLVLAWLKTDLSITNKRLVGKSPNTLFGIIPLGNDEISYPLRNIASVGVSTKFYFLRFVFGIILLFFALSTFGSSFIGGVFLLALSALPLLNSFTSRIQVANNAGQPVDIEISILEKDKAQTFVNKVNVAISDAA